MPFIPFTLRRILSMASLLSNKVMAATGDELMGFLKAACNHKDESLQLEVSEQEKAELYYLHSMAYVN